MKGTRPLSAFNAALTWLLVGLMAEPQANLLGQQVSPYERALEVLIAQVAPTEPLSSRPIQQTVPSAIPLLSRPAAASPPAASPLAQAASAGVDTNLFLNLTRTPVTLTNGNQLLALSFFSDSNHNYVVEFRDELGLDLCNNWQPLTNAPHNYGIVFTEAQITNRFYRLRRIDVPRSPLFALLANDTGTNSLDGLTSDPTIMGMALRFPDGTTLQISLDHPGGPFVAITNLGAPRHFVLTREMLNSIQGGPLSDGPHTLYMRAENAGQTLASFELPFTLDTTPPVVSVSLAPEFDSPPLGDGRTAFNPVTLTGQTEPGTRLELLGAVPSLSAGGEGRGEVAHIYSITPDSNGSFALTNVVLAQGTNQFYFRALDAACNETNSVSQVCWYGPDCTFADSLDGWLTFASSIAGTPGTVSVAPDKSCAAVLTEGDSFLVTLSRDFVIPTLPSTLNVTYSQLSFDPTTTGAMRDAFEVALVDGAGRPLTYTIQGTNAVTPASVSTSPVLPPSPDACFNHTDGHEPFHATGTAHVSDPLNPGSRVLAIDVAHLPPGSVARLILRLVNNDRDRATSVRITKAGFDSSSRALNFGGTSGTALSTLSERGTIASGGSASHDCAPPSFRTARTGIRTGIDVPMDGELGPQLLRNPSFEIVQISFQGQGLLPDEWNQYASIDPGADTYSVDGSVGIGPGGFGQFSGGVPHEGARWVAGAAFGNGDYEGMAQRLSAPLVPGEYYAARGFLRITTNRGERHPGGYDVFLSVTNNPLDESRVADIGRLGPVSITTEWQQSEFPFVAPTNATSFNYIVFRPFKVDPSVTSYIGLDNLLLAQILDSQSESRGPQLVVEHPANESRLPVGTATLNGVALAPVTLDDDAGSRNRITLVTVNGSPVDALDAAGNFFDAVEIRPGVNVFEVVATDMLNQSTTNTVTVYGTTCPQNFASLGEVSASVVPEYGRTSFNEWTKVLYADLALRNVGTYPLRAPFYVGVTRISDSSVRLLSPDGVSADGIPYYDYSATLNTDSLNTDALSAPRALAFHNPNKVQFTYELVVLGQLNQAPNFTTTPVLEAIVGRPYAYAFNATDPDGDALTYSLLSSPTGMVLNAQLSTLNFQPLTSQLGTHDIRIRADDGKGGLAEQHYLLSVIDPQSNRPPYFVSKPVTLTQGGMESDTTSARYSYDADAIDPDGDELTYAFATSSRYSDSVLKENPVGYWRLGENSGTIAVDSSMNGNHGAYVGNLELGSPGGLIGDSNESVLFRGGRVEVPDAPIHRPPVVTLEAWVEGAPLQYYGPIVMKAAGSGWNDGYGLFKAGIGNTIYFYVNHASLVTVGATLPAGRWNHVVGTYDGTTVRLFINGQQVDSRLFDGALYYFGGSRLMIGAGPGDFSWNGGVDEVAIYDKVLPAETIRTHFEAGRNGAPAAPKGMTIDARTGIIRWNPTAAQIGTHNVGIEVHDGRGGSDTQSYVVCVLPDLTPVFSPESVDLLVSSVDTHELRFDGQALTVSGTVSATIANQGPDDVRRPFEVTFFEDRNNNGAFDSSVDNMLGRTVVAERLPANSEVVVTTPVSAVCRFGGIPVWAFVDSAETVLETDENNNTGRNACDSAPPVREFNPVVKWKKDRFVVNPESDQVIMTPAVADLDGDGVPEIIFSSYDFGNYNTNGLLRAIRGTDGAEVWTMADPTNRIIAAAGLAVGDIDNDGQLEIVAVHTDTSLIAFEHDGSFKWKSAAQIGTAEGTIFPYQWGAPSLADLDRDGRPEIVFGAMVFEADGSLRWRGRPGSGKGNFGWGYLSTVVDLDLDGVPEVLAGNTAYRADGTIYWTSYIGDGFTAVGNFDDDSFPEIALIGGGGRLNLLNHNGTIKWQRLPPNVGTGAPIVADLDGDGRPEIGLATPVSFDVYDSVGAPKWSMPTFDQSSQTTGASAFDFDGDGRAEVIYSDEWSLSIFRGTDGEVLFQMLKSSCTCSEYPVIADVNGDGSAEIVTVANTSCGWGAHQGIRLNGIYVIGDSNNTWVSTRKIWNQHGYHIDNVNDDGTIPRQETNSWLTHNTYRLNLPLPDDLTAPDLVPSYVRIVETNGTAFATARIGNAGSKTVPPGIHLAFYDGVPGVERSVIGTTLTLTRLNPGSFEDVTFALGNQTATDIWVAADDDGTGLGQIFECNETNNLYRTGLPLPLHNHPPVITSAPVTNAIEGSLYAYLVQATDPDAGDTLSFSLGAAPEGMTIGTDTGRIDWTPQAAENGAHFVQVTVADRQGARGFQLFSVNVTNRLNASPVFVSRPVTSAPASESYFYFALAMDAENDSLAYELITRPEGMIVETNTGVVAWRPLLGQLGVHDVVLRVSDGNGGVALQSWQITVVPPNSAPVFTTLPASPAVAGLPWQYHVRAQDAEGQALTFQLASNAPAGMALIPQLPNSQLLQWTPTLAQLGANPIEIIVRDEAGTEARQTFDLEVVASAPNRAPQFVTTPRTQTRLNAPYTYTVNATDADGDPLMFTLVNGPSGMVLTGGSPSPQPSPPGEGVIQWTPQELGVFPVVLTISDGRVGGVVTQAFTITVSSTLSNSPPLITSQPPRNATAGQPYEYNPAAIDPDDDPVTWRLVNGPVGMSLDPATGVLRWNPTLDQLGTNFVTLEVQDALLATDVQTWAIDVECLNRPPQITSIPPTAAQTGEPYLYAVRATDPDGDTVTLSFADTNAFPVPDGMTISNLVGGEVTRLTSNQIAGGSQSLLTSAATGFGSALVRWMPATNQAGTYTVRIRATDRRGGNDTQTYNLHVADLRANKSPVMVSTPVRGATVGRPYSYTLRATDPDGDTLTLSSLIALPVGAMFSPSPGGEGRGEGELSWTPTSSQLGPQEFILAASDPAGASAAQRFFVAVRSNQPPVITSTPRTNAVPGAAYRYDVIASDPDGDALAYAFDSPVPSGMTIDSLGRVAWTPSAGQLGSFAISVSASDGFGASASQSFRLNVLADTEPPQVSLSLVQGLVDPASGQWAGNLGDTVRVRVDASDNVGVAARYLYRGTNSYPLDATFTASIPVTSGGLFSLDGVAVDFAGNSNTTTRTILFRDPNATNQIFVQIHTPTNGARLTGLTPVRATITNAVDIVSWSWGYALASEVNLSSVVISDPAFTIMGPTNVPPGVRSLEDILIGTFDPSALQNDAYVLAVAATDANGNTWTEPVLVNVEGNLKFGEFRLEFTDLAIPVAGIPITITRIYDTRDARRVGDFGHGWSLGVQDAKIRKTLVDQGWGPTMFPGSRVYVTKPDGQRVGFTAFAERQVCFVFCFADVGLRPDAGVQDRLAIVDNSATFFSGMFLGGLADSPYSPTAFRLTTKEGTVYSYEENIGLTNVTDLNGNRLEYTRDGIFHYNAGSATADQSVRFVRDTRGRIRQIIDPNGKALTYSYDGAGDLRSFADQTTNTTRYFYSASRAHFLTNIVDPLGRSALRLEYDDTGRLKTVRDANGNPISQDFDPTTKAATFTDGNGTVIHTRFDDNGNETYRRIDGVYTNTFAYDANNNLLATTNGRGFSTNYTYDARGNVTAIRDSLGNRTSIAYNEQSKPVGVTNALGQTLHLGYNSSGQLTQVVNNAGFKTAVTRDAQGRVVSLTDATGTNTTVFDYSNGCACGRPGKVINPDGSFRLYEYNSQGLTNRVVNELSAETLFHHDDSGRLLWMRDPLTNYTQFFYNGPLLTNIVDALGRSTRYEYDALNRTNRIIDAEGGVIEFRYDNNGNRTHVIDAVTNVTTFVYDAANRLIQQIDPLGHTNFFAHDAAGNRTEVIDRNGRRRTFAYDAANRMTNELWWEGTNVVRSVVFGFNELGVQTLATDPAARYEYSYDALNRLERVLAQSVGVPDFTLFQTYTALGQVESVTDNWGVRVGSSYDNRNRLASRAWSSTLPGAGVDPARVDFACDVSGNRVRTDRFSDLSGTNRIGFTTNAYNRAGIVTNITHLGPASQVLAKYDYNFDAAFQITRWAINNQLSDFAYDRTGQLTNALNTAQPNENFRFDANGNRVGAQSGGSYVVGRNNQILSDGTNHYAYDFEGNMTSRSNTVTGVLTTYQWDHRNRLLSVLDYNLGGVVTQTVAFVYDAMNRRLAKTVNSQTTRFLYNGDDSWADLDASNAVTARYLHGARIDELLARQRVSDGRGWYLTDHLGTVRDIANAAGAVVAHVDYSSFGQVLGVSSPGAVDRFLFTGRELDGETGLYFYRARYYSADLGRFVSEDPIGFDAQDFNIYRYVNNSPLLGIDPLGTDFIGDLTLRIYIAVQNIPPATLLGLQIGILVAEVQILLEWALCGVNPTSSPKAQLRSLQTAAITSANPTTALRALLAYLINYYYLRCDQ